MERRRRKFSNRVVLMMSLAAWLGACSVAAIDKGYPGKTRLVPPEGPVTEGGVFFVSVVSPDEISAAEGEFQGKAIPFFSDANDPSGGHRMTAIVGVEFGTAPGAVPMTVKVGSGGGATEKKLEIEVKAGIFPSEKLSVPPRTVAPSAKDMIRIRRDQAILAKAYGTVTQSRLWDPPAVLPVELGLTSVFGTSRVYNGKKTNAHLGADLRAPSGTPILAPLSGRVAVARYLFFTGYTVILDHGYGLFTIYGHMSRLKVKEGQAVRKGETMGLSGATGRASGPHLHWGVNLHGVKVDPLVLVRALK